jgi:hypothetical protein
MRKSLFNTAFLSVLIFFYSFLLFVPVNLSTADLGRHIRNGELILKGNFDLLYRNFYSYTYPDFPFINHHWLGGVIFFLVSSATGITGVQLLFIFVNLLTFYLFFNIALKNSNIYVTSLTALLAIPVIAYRDEVRPEVFSYLFAALYYYVLRNYVDRKINWKKLLWLLPIAIIWVNTHIYFFLGFFIICTFWVVEFIKTLKIRDKERINRFKALTLTALSVAVVSLINPFFINGVVYPFKIFGNYGYRVLENQSVFFLEQVINLPVIIYFKIVFSLLVLSWVYKVFRLIKHREGVSWADLILSCALSVLAFIQVRNFAIFGFFAIVSISQNFSSLKFDYPRYLVIPALALVFIFMMVVSPSYWEARNLGIGPARRVTGAGEFFTKQELKGPVFNNYDIGGYLIYYLYPQEKVFVDNRPEGYPAEFFKKTYVPMQEKDEIWKAKDAEYGFNAIFFYRQDLTPWAQNFLVSRIKDSGWAAIYVDDFNIIFLKRNPQNNELIKRFELPKEMFKVN